MKAIIKKEDCAGVWMADVAKPTIGDFDVLIKPHLTSICGTDTHIYKWNDWAKKNVPLGTTLGHEFVGEIVELGKKVTAYQIGEIVSGEGHLTCGECRNCKTGKPHLCPNTKGLGIHCNGCYAEYFSLPASNLFRVPKGIPEEIAAVFDPLGNAVHTALSFDMIGEDVLITGAGPIGTMATAIARHVGARNIVITDIHDERLALAKKMGATATVNVAKSSITETVQKLGITDGFAVGLEMSGAPSALNALLKHLMPGGKIALLGILPKEVAIDWDLVIFKMLHIKGIYGREIFSTWYKMSHMIQSGLDISPIVTHKFPADRFQEGFDTMLAGKCGKVLLDWR